MLEYYPVAPRTYCNPLPLPHYPKGMAVADRAKAEIVWWGDQSQDFREAADPTCIYHDGAWYLYPSCDMAWISYDLVHWEFVPCKPDGLGYAPTVCRWRDRFLLTSQSDRLWESIEPLGPWQLRGHLSDENGQPAYWWDPCLFLDDDGALYCYFFRRIPSDGIWVVRMHDDDPCRFGESPVFCFGFDPSHRWEWYGDSNQDSSESWIEGPWMTKANGRYYLQYSGGGAQWKTYAVGCYVGDTPLGPWRYQTHNPILRDAHGLLNGTAHHSIVQGPNKTLWCFYTVLVRIEGDFERRLAMDPAGFNLHGELLISGPTNTPQLQPGLKQEPWIDNSSELYNLTHGQRTTASSHRSGRGPWYATDEQIRTWWEPEDETHPWLQVDLGKKCVVSAVRVMFADRGLDYALGIVPAPYKYQVDVWDDSLGWQLALDRTANESERHIDYREFESVGGRYVRLIVHAWPAGMRVGVWEFTAFGEISKS